MFNFNLKTNNYVRPVLYYSLFVSSVYAQNQIQTIHTDFSQAGSELVPFLNAPVYIPAHGCWCSKLESGASHDSLGGAAIDDLDQICKSWFQARACILKEGPAGACNAYTGAGTYDVQIEAAGTENTCLGNNSHACEQDACTIDAFFSNQVDQFFIDNPAFQVVPHNGQCQNGSGGNGVTKYCYGTAPGVYLSSDAPAPPAPPANNACDNAEFDMSIVIDGSASVGDDEWTNIVNFVSTMTGNFDLGQDKTRVSIMQYSYNLKYYTTFSADAQEIESRIDELAVEQMKSATMTNIALHTSIDNMMNNGRNGVPQILVLITDGRSSRGLMFPSANHQDRYNTAAQLHNLGITSFVVAVTDSVDDQEVSEIATDPDANFLTKLDDFESLSNIVNTISNTACGMSRTVGAPRSPAFKAEGKTPESGTYVAETNVLYGLPLPRKDED